MSYERRSVTFSDKDSSQINPREKSTLTSWDGREYVPSEKSKTLARRALIGFGVIFATVIAITPMIDKEQFQADSIPKTEEEEYLHSKLSAEQQKLVDKVLVLNGLFKPNSLDSQP